MIVDDGKYYLYRHVRLDTNQVFYIGIGSKIESFSCKETLYKRAYSKYYRSSFWNSIIKKCEYTVEILMESDDYEFIKEKEIEFIALYGRRDIGLGTLTNLSDGGEGAFGVVRSDEYKEMKRKESTGRIPTEETRKKISQTLNRNKITYDVYSSTGELCFSNKGNVELSELLNCKTEKICSYYKKKHCLMKKYYIIKHSEVFVLKDFQYTVTNSHAYKKVRIFNESFDYIFDSYKQACDYFNLPPHTVRNALNYKIKLMGIYNLTRI